MYARWIGTRTVTAILAVSLLTSCSALNPHVQVPDASNGYKTSPTMYNAIQYASSLRSEYRNGIKDHYYINSGVGITLVSMASVVAFLGAISEGSTAIPALAAGGAGLYGASKLVTNVDHQMIYAVGANWVSCVLATYEPLYSQIYGGEVSGENQSARLLKVTSDIAELKSKADAARGLMSQVLSSRTQSSDSSASPDSAIYEVYLSRLKAAEQSGVRAQAALDIAHRASGRLMADIQSVQAAVDIALVKSTPKIEDVITIIGTAVPTLDKIPKRIKPIESSDIEQSQSASNLKIEIAVHAAESVSAGLEVFAQSIVEPVSSDIVEKCTAGLNKATPALAVVPDSGIDLPAKAGARGDARISGGKLPYSPPRWLGIVPLDSVLELRSDISGVVSVVVKDPAKAAGNYIFAVSDLSGSSVSVDVRVAAPAVQSDNPASVSATTKADVEVLQKALISQNCLTPKGKDGKPNADGNWGRCTTNALTTLAEAAKGTSAFDRCSVVPIGLDSGWMSRNPGKTAELAACFKDAKCSEPVSVPETCKAP